MTSSRGATIDPKPTSRAERDRSHHAVSMFTRHKIHDLSWNRARGRLLGSSTALGSLRASPLCSSELA
jgi:hypothetical protein